jgi:hypothetical protein
MALDLAGLSAYTDENKMDLIKKSILEGRTVGLISVQPDIKSSATINILDTDLILAAGACGWSANGTTTLSQRTLSVCSLKSNESICLDDLEAYYTQSMLNAGSYNEQIPFEQMYSESKAEKLGAAVEDIVWQGDTISGSGNLALCDGFVKLFADDAFTAVVDGNVSGATAINSLNIIDLVDDMCATIPSDIINADDLHIFCGYETYRLYAKALRDANLFHYDGAENDFMQMVPGTNIKIIAVRGLNGTDKMVATKASNLFMGTDLLSDFEDFRIFYSEDNDEVRFRFKGKIGVQAAFLEFVVFFSL